MTHPRNAAEAPMVASAERFNQQAYALALQRIIDLEAALARLQARERVLRGLLACMVENCLDCMARGTYSNGQPCHTCAEARAALAAEPEPEGTT